MITITPKTSVEKAIEPLAVDTKDAARMLGISPRTVEKLAERGEIVRKKIGWRSLYTVSSIKRFWKHRRSTNEKKPRRWHRFHRRGFH